jgi:hypothetical protein
MVKIPKRGKDPFLTPKHVEDGDLATIIEPPYIQSAEKSKFGKERTMVTVKIKRTGEVFRWGLNTTSNDRLVERFGEEGDLWVGKEVRIQRRSENVRGQDRDVLYALPSVQAEIAPAEKPVMEA